MLLDFQVSAAGRTSQADCLIRAPVRLPASLSSPTSVTAGALGKISAPPGPAPGGDFEYVTREELQALSKMGRLVCCYSAFGGADLYALGVDTIDAIARQGRAAVFPIELEGIHS